MFIFFLSFWSDSLDLATPKEKKLYSEADIRGWMSLRAVLEAT